MMTFVDTSRDFWKERRVVFVTPPGGPEAPEHAAKVETQQPAEQTAQEKFEAKKNEFRGKVAGAQKLIEDIKNVYVDEDESVDTKAEANDAAVKDLYAKLNTGLGAITSKFETESAKIEDSNLTKLQALDNSLVTEVFKAIEVQPATDKALDAGIKEKAVTAAQVENVAVLEANLKTYEAAHEKDVASFRNAELKLTERQNILELIKIAYPGKNYAPLKAVLTAFSDNSNYKNGIRGDNLDPAVLDAATTKLESDFTAKAKTLTGVDSEAMMNKIQEALSATMTQKAKEWSEKLLKGEALTLNFEEMFGKIAFPSVSDLNFSMNFALKQAAGAKEASIIMSFPELNATNEYPNKGAYLTAHPSVPAPDNGKSISIDRTVTAPPFLIPAGLGIHSISYKETVSASSDGKIKRTVSDFQFLDDEDKPIKLTYPLGKPLASLTIDDLAPPSGGIEANKNPHFGWDTMSSGDVSPPDETTSGTEEPKTAESASSAPKASRDMADGLLTAERKIYPDGCIRTGEITLNSGGTLSPERLAELGITNPDKYNATTYLEEKSGSNEAYLVFDHKGTTFTQAFTDEASFKKIYPSTTLPAKGASADTTDVIVLSQNRPEPYAGLRRESALNVSVDKDGKITVNVSNIKFGYPANDKVYVPLGKGLNDIKSASDILYPPGYAPQSGEKSGGDASETSVREDTEGMEIKSLEEYKKITSELKRSAEGLPEIDPKNPRFSDLPKFLINDAMIASSTIDSSIGLVDKLIVEARALEQNSTGYALKLREIAKAVDAVSGQLDQASADHAVNKFNEIQKNGLSYGPPNGRDPNAFKTEFGAANLVLENRFIDADEGGDSHYVDLSGARIMMQGTGNDKHISGRFEVKVRGYDGPKVASFSFNNVGPLDNWEDLVTMQMEKLIKSRDVRKDIKEQRRERNDVNNKIEFVNGKEQDQLAKRLKDHDPFKHPDYEGKNERDVIRKIKEDLGNPAEYLIRLDKDGDEVQAIRQAPRGASTIPSGEFGVAAGLNETSRKIESINDKEQDNLAKRLKDHDPFKHPDYEGEDEGDVVKKIREDLGNPAEYLIRRDLDKDGDEVQAIRQAPRGASTIPSGEFGVAAGLIAEVVIDPADDENPSEEQENEKSPIGLLVERCSKANIDGQEAIALEADIERALDKYGATPHVVDTLIDSRAKLLTQYPQFITSSITDNALALMNDSRFEGLSYEKGHGVLRINGEPYQILYKGDRIGITATGSGADQTLNIVIISNGKNHIAKGTDLASLRASYSASLQGPKQPEIVPSEIDQMTTPAT